MRIEIRSCGLRLTKKQTVRLQQDLDVVFARFGEQIDRVTVAVSDSSQSGLTACEIEVRIKQKLVTVVHSDRDVFVAVEHAAKRAARTVRRAIDIERLVRP
jgi:ribosome-associated translation inhibitor RaiA